MQGHGSGQDQVINSHCKDAAFYAGPIRCRLGSVFHAHGRKRRRPHSGEFGSEPSDGTWPVEHRSESTERLLIHCGFNRWTQQIGEIVQGVFRSLAFSFGGYLGASILHLAWLASR
jgi:hypothetical protein